MTWKDGEIYDVISPAQHAKEEGDYTIPLYLHPVKELTIHEDIVYGIAYKYGIEKGDVLDFARAILRKAQEK